MDRPLAEGDVASDEVLREKDGVSWYELRVPDDLAGLMEND